MKKVLVFFVAILLLVTSLPVMGNPLQAALTWSPLEVKLDTGLENLEYNGSVYVGYKGSDVYYSKDSRSWEKVYTVKGENNTTVTLVDIFRVGDGSAFLLQDTAGQFYKSIDGVKWEKALKEEPVKGSTLAEYNGGTIYLVKEGNITTYPVTQMGNVKRVKVVSDKLVLFTVDLNNASQSVLYYALLRESPNKVKVNGKFLNLDVEPQLVNDRMLVPFRAIVEALGGVVSWDESTQTVTAKKGDKVVLLQIDNTIAKVNGVEIKLDVPAKLINNRTLIPVRFVSESLGANVIWDYLENVAIVDEQTSAAGPAVPVPIGGGGSGSGGDTSGNQLKKEIVDKYTAEAQKLENESTSRLQALINEGMREYFTTPADQLGALKAKYEALANELKKEIDGRFENIVSNMKEELEANNLSTEAVQEAQEKYEKAKADYEGTIK